MTIWVRVRISSICINTLQYCFSVVATTSQCYVYTTKNWNTPVIFDLRNGAVTLIVQAPGHFLLTDATGVHLYYYEGRFKCTATWPGIRPDMLTSATVSLSPDTIGR